MACMMPIRTEVSPARLARKEFEPASYNDTLMKTLRGIWNETYEESHPISAEYKTDDIRRERGPRDLDSISDSSNT